MSFRVVRQDDNGVRTVMATFAARADAEAMAATYEARAHKQMYWVEIAIDEAPPAHDHRDESPGLRGGPLGSTDVRAPQDRFRP